MLVVLRLAIGWHFLYEGIWKIRHPDQFVGETEGFLSGARGPVAGLFYGMVPDIDGHQRLEANLVEVDGKDAAGKPAKILKLAKSWDDLRQKFVDFYRPAAAKDGDEKLHEQLTEEAAKVYQRHVKGLNDFVKENGDKIKAHFESLKRYEEGLKSDPRTMFQRQRRWDEMQDLRKEAKGWISDLDGREIALKSELLDLLRPERKSEVEAVAKADKADKDAAAKAAASAPAAAEAKKPETVTEKPAEKESKKFKPATTRPKSADTKKTSGSVKPKSAVEDKPSDPPQDMSAEPAKAKAKSKETVESGSEESGDGDEGKTAAKEGKSPKQKGDKKKSDLEGANPQAAEKPKEAAEATVVVVDFSPLAKGRPENGPFARSSNILSWKRTEQLALLLTWTLAAIGLCLMLGLFTRPAALLGAGFLLFVVMSQPSYNGVYPLDPPQLGHALLVNKDFVEMIALLLIASTCLGRWTGLDYFIHTCLVKPFCCRSGNCTTTEGRKA